MFNPERPGPDYELRWPREIFRSELDLLLGADAMERAEWTDEVELLFTEAFVSDTPRYDFLEARDELDPPGLPRGEMSRLRARRTLLGLIRTALNRLPEQAAPRPYYAARAGASVRGGDQGAPGSADRTTIVQRDWNRVVNDLLDRGYLEQVAPRECVDANEALPKPDEALDHVFAQHLGVEGLWSPRPAEWEQGTFFSMIEVVHDLVARPRGRRYHSWNQCGYHYSNFAKAPAQMLYRWTVNRLLERNEIPLRLAKSGEDVGRLVHTVTDDRARLIDQAISTTSGAGDAVRHAVALFRARGARREQKRSACIALAGVLEQRRSRIKTELLSRDEGALFQIANQFDVRHRNADQRGDYDDAYLDWIFWWYLATIELIDRLTERVGQAEA